MARTMWISVGVLLACLLVHYSDSVSMVEENADSSVDLHPHDAQTMIDGKEDPRSRKEKIDLAKKRHTTIDEKNTFKRIMREENDMTKRRLQRKLRNLTPEQRKERKKKNKNNKKKNKKNKNKKNKKKNKKNKNKVRRKRFTFNDDEEPSKIWPNGVVNYQIASPLSSDANAVFLLMYVMQMFEIYTPIRFVSSTNRTSLNFIQDLGCWSYLGRIAWWDKQNISCCTHQVRDERYCIHEMGHALGLQHEHQNKYITDYLRPNDRAISDPWRYWFHPFYGTNNRYYDHVVDLDSPMSYAPWDFSTSWSVYETLTLFDDDYEMIVGNTADKQLNFYMYKEINELYGVGSTTCDDLECDFDGYPIYMLDNCTCMCPTGLSSEAEPGCSEIEVIEEVEGDDLAWPENVMLIKTDGAVGCPYGFTDNHWIQMQGGPHAVEYDTIYNFNANITSPEEDTAMRIEFCWRDSNATSNTSWPKGSYCINPLDGVCPEGFYEGVKKFNNSGNFSSNGLPSSIVLNGNETAIKFCCRNDSHFSIPAVFPRNDNFMSFPLMGRCQEVEGMQSTFQMVKYHNNEDASDKFPAGLLPQMGLTDGSITLYMCYYTKLFTNCGGTYEINENNTEVTFTTPNFPDNYPTLTRCTWAFKTTPGNKLKLVFNHFDIYMNPDGTADDEVEVRQIKIGNWGKKYIGFGRKQHHLSTENYMSVIFYSTETNTAKGLNATVSLVDESVLCYSGKGKNYDGKRNITKNFHKCLDWKTAAEKGAPHNPFEYSNLQDSLLGNYCRFPGDGLAPWCYVDFNSGYKREYCDVCNLQGCFDDDLGECSANLTLKRFCGINDNAELCEATCNCEDPSSSNCTYNDSRTDCQSSVDSLQPFCEQEESINHCARTCGYCDQMEAEPLNRTCNPPEDQTGLVQVKTEYDLGEVIDFTCPNSNRTVSWTCSSTGQWIINSQCDLVLSCPSDYNMIGEKCYKLIDSDENFDEAKELCAAENATMFMMKTAESIPIVTALKSLFPDIATFWIDLRDNNNSDSFVWGDGTPLSYILWLTPPFKLPNDCRRIYNSTLYSNRNVSEFGNDCLYWNSEAVRNASGKVYGMEDNFCTGFSMDSATLHCYVNDSGEIVTESCGEVPRCYFSSAHKEPVDRESNYTYTGKQIWTKDRQRCVRWDQVNETTFNLTDDDFYEGSKAAAGAYCRSPTNDYGITNLWCFTTMIGATGVCKPQPSCAKTSCYVNRQNIDGSYTKFLSWASKHTQDGRLCKKWQNTVYNADNLFPDDAYSAANAEDYCRYPYSPGRAWCFSDIEWWGFCDAFFDCCDEYGYERAYDYVGTRNYAWNNKKCIRWDSVPNLPFTDEDFPDGSIAQAYDYCRAPDASDHVFCYVFDEPTNTYNQEWCDVPQEKNIKDCVYYDRTEGRWIPTYCDDFHETICEKPVDVPVCADRDAPKCKELFAVRPEECKSTESLFGEDECRRTCGYCTDEAPQLANTDNCTEPTLNADIIKVTSTNITAVGEYFEYQCPSDKIAIGDLKRGCLPELTLTGINPSCVDRSEVDEWITNDVTMKDRNYVGPGRELHFIETTNTKIPKDGYLKAWSFFSESNTSLALYVLRPDYGQNFTVVNYTKVEHVLAFRSTTIELAVMNQFQVQSGDLIGWVMLDWADGGIPFDYCNGGVNPDDSGTMRLIKSVTNYTQPGNATLFVPYVWGDCRRYSLNAKIGPLG